MSMVTNAILTWGAENDGERDKRLEQINSFFEDPATGFVSVDDASLPRGWYGGTKMLECEIALGAFNYLDVERLVDHLRAEVAWDLYPHCVLPQLTVLEQEAAQFRVIPILVR